VAACSALLRRDKLPATRDRVGWCSETCSARWKAGQLSFLRRVRETRELHKSFAGLSYDALGFRDCGGRRAADRSKDSIALGGGVTAVHASRRCFRR